MSRNVKTPGETWFTGGYFVTEGSKAWRCRLATHICETLVQLLLGSIAWSFSPLCSFHYPSPKFPGRSFRKKFFGCANEPFARGYPAERGSGGARGRRLTNLARRGFCGAPRTASILFFRQGQYLRRKDNLLLLRLGLAGADLADHGRIEDSRCDLRG